MRLYGVEHLHVRGRWPSPYGRKLSRSDSMADDRISIALVRAGLTE